jgi:hypothetical protein
VPTSQSLTAIARRTDGFPVPDSVDSHLIDELNVYVDDERLSAEAILRVLAHPDHTVLALLRRLRRYALTGLDLSATRQVPPIAHAIKDDDADELLPAFTAWSDSAGGREISSAGPLLWASWRLSQPLGEVLRRMRLLLPDGWSLSAPSLGDLSNHTCTYDEARLLSRNFTTDHEWIEGEVLPDHIMRFSDEVGRPLKEILAMCDRFTPLGVRVAHREAYQDDFDLVETVALRFAARPGGPLSPLELVVIAGRAGISTGAAYRRLARLEQLGMLVRPGVASSAELTPTRLHLNFIEQELRDYAQSFHAFYITSTPWADIVNVIISDRTPEADLRIAQSLIPFTVPLAALAWQDLVRIASDSEMTIRQAADAFRDIYPDAQMPHIPAECADLTVPWGAVVALCGWRRWPYRQCSPGTIIGSMLYSRQPLGGFLGQLDAFRSLGAPVPAFDEDIRHQLNQVKLDEYDLDMLTLSGRFIDRRYLDTITPLNLVQISGRLGWTLAEAHQRFARLVPIGLTIEYPQADLPEEIVMWYDLLALTTYFDGQEPVISGRIDQEFLEHAAEEIFDAAPGQIPEKAALLRERLRTYAPLFQFELEPPEEESDGL